MAAQSAWVLNLDADLELAAYAAGSRYAPKASVVEAMRERARALSALVLGPHDVLVDAVDPVAGSAAGLVGRAFCPTPRAIDALARAGAIPEPYPAIETLVRVASRAFSASLGQTMERAAFVTDARAARAMLDDAPVVGRAWRIKRAYGMAGRAHSVVFPAPRAIDVAFLDAWIASGGVQIEPDVEILSEWAQHGMIAADGAARLGALTRQRVDARGAWISSERADNPEIALAVVEEARRAATALSEAGYFGPFGVDAFVWRDLEGRAHLRPRSEINARWTMGAVVGLGRP
jgi:hypothetical protein